MAVCGDQFSPNKKSIIDTFSKKLIVSKSRERTIPMVIKIAMPADMPKPPIINRSIHSGRTGFRRLILELDIYFYFFFKNKGLLLTPYLIEITFLMALTH